MFLFWREMMVNTKKRLAKEIQNLVDNAFNLLIIHYSCESFYNIKDGRTPRITSIAVRFFNTGQTVTLFIKLLQRRGYLLK